MKTNITTVNIARDDAKAPGLTQYDYGQKLLFTGADLPDYYEVHFSANFTDESVTQLGDAGGVSIPDAFLTQPGTVHAWIFLHNGMTDGETVRHITIPVAQRSAPGDGQPTPVEQSAFTEGIAALTAKTAEAAEQVELAAAQVALAAAQVDLAADEVDRAAAEADRAEAAAEDAQAIIREGAVPATRKINGHDLSADVTLTASDVGAVPDTRTVNNKALSADVTLGASDVGAVPTTRTVNSKALSADVTLGAADVGAVPTSRTVNGNALSADVSLGAADVGAVAKTGDTMTGALSVPGLNALGNYPGMAFRQSAGSTPTGYITENNATRRMYFTVVPTDAGGNEVYNLPAPSTGNTNQRNFDILTTKDHPAFSKADIDWTSSQYVTGNYEVRVEKSLDTVRFQGLFNLTGLTANTSVSIGTIPNGYRPRSGLVERTIGFSMTPNWNAPQNIGATFVLVSVYSDGTVFITPGATVINGGFWIDMTWCI